MDDDWDLHAVVKGCSAAGTTARAATAAVNTSADQNPFPSFSSINFHDEESLFDFHGITDHDGNDPFQGLQEIYQELCGGPPLSAAVIPAAAQVLQPHDHQEIMQIQPSLQMDIQLKNPILGSSSNSFPVMDSQPTRPGRRKNQQTKIVRQMTQDELSADSWAWRKYGQKPIKGSPYPRNYYRCSTSKGCAARKQVERSPTDPGIFIVSYSGEHSHPRPSHRSSLSGSTRTKFSTNRHNNMNNNTLSLLQKGSNISSSSPSGSSFSPPLMEGEEAAQNHRVEVVEEDIDGGGDEDDDENNVMNIPNDHLVNDDGDLDMFKGFHDSDDHDSSGGGGGDMFSCGLLSSPPWTPTSSAVNGGGCG